MAALQKRLSEILTRLRDVNTSQKVALFLGGLLVAVALIWMVQWAAAPEMVPLIDQGLAAEDLALVRSGLDALGEHYEIRGDRILVRAARNRAALYAQLQQQEKLPSDTSVGFAALIKESDPWISSEESRRRWTFALQGELERVLRELNGVRNARVLLNYGTQKRVFARTAPPSSASVALTMRGGDQVPRSLAIAAARLVAGAVDGLSVRNVEVVDANGRRALDWDAEGDLSTQLDRKVLAEEQRFLANLQQIILPFDPRAIVGVQVELNSTADHIETDTPTKAVPATERTMVQETVRDRSAGDPGVRPNTAMTRGGSGISESQRQETSETESRVGYAKQTRSTPPGDVVKVTAAISLSHSYLENVYRRRHPEAEGAPTDEQIEEIFREERTRLLPQVAQLLRPQSEENVAVSRYYDEPLDAPVTAAAAPLELGVDLVQRYGPQSGLALLALMALGLMLRMARRADGGEAFGLELGLPREAIEAAKAAAADVSLASAAMQRAGNRPAVRRVGPRAPGATEDTYLDAEPANFIEQAALSEGVLVAQEVDAGTVQTRKMLEQVATMVDEDAETVAALIEQWIQRNEQYREEN